MARLELSFLGPFQVLLDGKPVNGFESNKVRALLAYLAVESDRPHRREGLCGLLWPDWPQASALSNLRNALSDLRGCIHDSTADPPFLLISRDSLQFNLAADARLDSSEFEHLLRLSQSSSPQPDSPQSEIKNLQSAIALSHGPFLEGFSLPDSSPFEDWLAIERERLQQEQLEALGCLADLYESQGELEQALAVARRVLLVEPWLEEGHQRAMRLLALSGQRGAALVQFETCRSLLLKELGVEPGVETKRLYAAIRDGQLERVRPASRPIPEPFIPEPPIPGPCPYQGLRFYDEAQAGLFFGREAVVERLAERLLGREGCRFLAVIGASGSGKSSVVRAGLIPAVRKRPGWTAYVLTPTAHPLEALAEALTRTSESLAAAETLLDDLVKDPRSLRLFARRLAASQGCEGLLLVVDQFEELFSLCREEAERRAFVDNLMEAVSGEGPLRLAIALRADFYAACAPYETLRRALGESQEFIGPMDAGDLRRAIEEPARLAGWELEDGLADLFLREVGAGGDHQTAEPGMLPLLSHALLETWLRRQGRRLTLAGYAEAGGVQGAITQTAESVYAGLSPEEQATARAIFLRLTEVGEGVQETRRRAPLAELLPEDGQGRQVLKRLADARLVTTTSETAEVAHEALIREWGRLREWLNEDREGLRLHRRLTEAAQEWDGLGRDAGGLYRGLRLALAGEWASRNPEALNRLEREFLEASQAEMEREAAEGQARRQRELEAAQKLLEEQTSSARKLRRRAIWLALALVAAFVLAAAAFISYGQAAYNTRLATARELAAASQLSQKVDQQRSILLALQAIKKADLPETENAIHQAISSANLRDSLTDIDAYGVAIAPDGKRFSTFGQDGTIQTWELNTETLKVNRSPLLKIKNTIDNQLTATAANIGVSIPIAYSPDGSRIAAISDRQTVKIWDAASGQLLNTLYESFPGASCLAFSPDGKLLATANIETSITVWDVLTGKVLQNLYPKDTNYFSAFVVNFDQEGNYLAAGSADGVLSIWQRSNTQQDSQNYAPFHFLSSIQENNPITAITFSPSGKELSLGAYTFIKQYDISSISTSSPPKLINSIQSLSQPLIGLKYIEDGKTIVGGGFQSTIQIWDSITGEELHTLTSTSGIISGIALSRENKSLISIHSDSSLKVWDVSQAGNQEWFTLPAVHLYSNFSSDGKYLVGPTTDSKLAVWELTLPVIKRMEIPDPIITSCLSYNGPDVYRINTPPCLIDTNLDFSRLVTLGDENQHQTARIWSLTTGQLISQHVLDTARIVSMELSPDGTRLVVDSDDGTISVMDIDQWKLLFSLSYFNHTLSNDAFSPEGNHLVTGSLEGVIRIWDARTGELQQVLEGHTGPVFSKFISDGKRIISGSLDRTAKIWDAQTYKEIMTLGGNAFGVEDVAFSRDGRYIATASAEGSVRVWDARTGQELFTFPSGTGFRLTFTPDSKHLIIGNYDVFHPLGTIKGYSLDMAELVAIARSRLTRTWTPEECKQFLHRETCPPAP